MDDAPVRSVDLLADAGWECASSLTIDGEIGRPPEDLRWMPASVPGTAARALVDAEDPSALVRDYDSEDWWFRTRFAAPDGAGAHVLRVGGLATIADVWLNGRPILHSENMFVAHEVVVGDLGPSNELVIRCTALGPTLRTRRPRPRWKCRDLVHQNLRWIRTTLSGRLTGGVQSPAPVGPWRPITLVSAEPVRIVERRIRTRLDDSSRAGFVDVEVTLEGVDASDDVWVEIDGKTSLLQTAPAPRGIVARGVGELDAVELWWPHTHGAQPLYEVVLGVNQIRRSLGRVGFRTIQVDRSDGAFTISCNSTPVFCRGVCWTPPDPVALSTSGPRLRQLLESVRRGNLNMVRVTGVGVYETDEFLDLCDELGIMVWHDCMFAFCDVPSSDEFQQAVTEELQQQFGRWQARPSITVVCGGSENEQQAAYLGLPPDQWVSPIAERLIPALVDDWLPGTVYVRNSPSGSPLPSMVDRGPSHYFSVGAYLQPIEDARRARVRFASECLAFANPAEPLDTVEGIRALTGIGHHPAWKASIHRDAAVSWDLEDIRDWYTARLFDVDPVELRRSDPERALTLARATVAEVFESVFAEWRHPGSGCVGALVLQATDAVLGGGIGLIDAVGRPKSSWYVMRRMFAPKVVGFVDEGVNGLRLYVASDSSEPWAGTVRIGLYLPAAQSGETVTHEVKVNGDGLIIETATAFGGFRDLNHAHKFGPPAYDVVTATLFDLDGTALGQAFFLPGGRRRDVEHDIGLTAKVSRDEREGWLATVSTERFAQWVSFDMVGWYAEDAWFHLVPDAPRTVRLLPVDDSGEPPRGAVTAVNTRERGRLEVVS